MKKSKNQIEAQLVRKPGRIKDPLEPKDLKWFKMGGYSRGDELDAAGWARALLVRRALFGSGPKSPLGGLPFKEWMKKAHRVAKGIAYPSESEAQALRGGDKRSCVPENLRNNVFPELLTYVLENPLPSQTRGPIERSSLSDGGPCVVNARRGARLEGGYSTLGRLLLGDDWEDDADSGYDAQDEDELGYVDSVVTVMGPNGFPMNLIDRSFVVTKRESTSSASRRSESPRDEFSGTIKNMFATAVIDITRSDEEIFASLKKWLHTKREARFVMSPKKAFSDADFRIWHQYRLLAYLDLCLIAIYMGRQMPWPYMGEVLYKNWTVGRGDKTRKTVSDLAENLVFRELQALIEQATNPES